MKVPLSWVEWHTCSSDGAAIITKLIDGTSPIQDKDPYDGGLAVVATHLPADDGGEKR